MIVKAGCSSFGVIAAAVVDDAASLVLSFMWGAQKKKSKNTLGNLETAEFED